MEKLYKGHFIFYFFIQPSYPPSQALLLFQASHCGGLSSSVSGSTPAIFEPRAADHDWVSAIGMCVDSCE